MRGLLIAGILASPLLAAPAVAQAKGSAQADPASAADTQSVENHVITVSRSGESHAKPDLGILIMSIRSSSPIPDEAVAQNGQKATAVELALAKLGFSPSDYQISTVTIAQAGAGMPHFPVQQEIAAYDATQYIYVFFGAADLSDVGKLTQKTAMVIEALRKAGAVPANSGSQYGPMPAAAQGALIIYTVKEPAQYEHEALQVAISRARDAAQEIAAGTGVQITGLRNVQSGYLSGNVVPRSGASPLEGLKYRWFTTKSDELQIIANATLQYDFK